MFHTRNAYFVDRVETISVFASWLEDAVGTGTKTIVSIQVKQ